jgi:hypothetical protein
MITLAIFLVKIWYSLNIKIKKLIFATTTSKVTMFCPVKGLLKAVMFILEQLQKYSEEIVL